MPLRAAPSQLGTLTIALQMAFSPLLAPAAALGARLTLLAVALAATVLNMAYLEPQTTKVMKARAELEKMSNPIASGAYPGGKEKAMKELSASFGKLHGASSVANLVALCAAIIYGWRYVL